MVASASSESGSKRGMRLTNTDASAEGDAREPEEVLEHDPAGGVLAAPLLGVELRSPPRPLLGGEGLDGAAVAAREQTEAGGQGAHLVRVVLPDRGSLAHAREQVGAVHDLDLRERRPGRALGARDGAAGCARQELHAGADAEQRPLVRAERVAEPLELARV